MVSLSQAVLLVKGNPDEGNTISLPQGITILGRSPLNDIVIDHPCASRQHAAIRGDSVGYWIADLGSRNGTYVNGERLGPEPRLLRNLNRIELGSYTECQWVFMESRETSDMPRPSSRLRYEQVTHE